MSIFDLDEHGYPVLLSNVPVADQAPQPIVPSSRPATVNHDEWARRQDAVRDAAREFESLTEQDLRERLKGLTTKPMTSDDLTQFKIDVRQQVLDDLIDIIDQRVRGKLRGRRMVRVLAPNGYSRKLLRSLDQAEADAISARLKARGWTDAQLESDFTSKLTHLTKL